MNRPHFPPAQKIITKLPKGNNNVLSLINRLKMSGVPSSVVSAVEHISEVSPSSIRKLKFEKNLSSKSLSTLAKLQSARTLQLSL